MSKLDEGDIEDYKNVITDTLGTLYMDGKMGGKGYQGMALDNLATNILNMLDDCNDDLDAFKEAVSKVFTI